MEQHTAHSRWWGRDTPNVRRIVAVAYLLMLLILVAYAQIRPVNNWDMLAYVGIARSIEVNDADELHAEVYRLLRRSVPASDVEALTGTSSEATTSLPFLEATANDPRAFIQQLPFYLVKPAYPLLIAGVSLLGIDPFDASVLIASAAYVAFALLLAAWLRRYHPPLLAYGLATLLVLSPPFSILARLSTPDSLSLLTIVASAYLLVERRRAGIALTVAILSIFVRPNNAVWVILLAAYVAFWVPSTWRPPRWVAAGAAGAALAIYGGLTWWAGYYSFPTLFYHALVEYLAYPADFTSPLTLLDYPRQYVHELLAFQYGSALLFLFIASAGALALARVGGPERNLMSGILVLALVAAGAQWLAYPIEPERILVSQLALIAVVLAVALGTRRVPQPIGVGSE